jgi:hypothetical protein
MLLRPLSYLERSRKEAPRLMGTGCPQELKSKRKRTVCTEMRRHFQTRSSSIHRGGSLRRGKCRMRECPLAVALEVSAITSVGTFVLMNVQFVLDCIWP